MNQVVKAMLVVIGCAAVAGCVVERDGEDSVSRTFGSDFFGVGGMLNLADTVEGDAILAGGMSPPSARCEAT
jgi:hypothetical protein